MKTLNDLMITLSAGLILLLATAVAADDYCVQSQSPVVTFYFGVEVSLPDPAHPVTLPACHTDIGIPLHFNGWDIHLHSEEVGLLDPEDGLFALAPEHRYVFSSVPPAFDFLGVGAGQTFWYYAAAPSPGFNSEDLSDGEQQTLCWWDPNDAVHNADTPARWLAVRLIDVRGPKNGNVSMWQEHTGSPVVYFSTCDGGITDHDVYYLPAGLHSHNSWAFTQPGLYAVDLQVSTFYVCDGALTADLNSDCRVNLEDYSVLGKYWLAEDTAAVSELQRFSDPNQIDLADLDEISGQWLLSGSPFVTESSP